MKESRNLTCVSADTQRCGRIVTCVCAEAESFSISVLVSAAQVLGSFLNLVDPLAAFMEVR